MEPEARAVGDRVRIEAAAAELALADYYRYTCANQPGW